MKNTKNYTLEEILNTPEALELDSDDLEVVEAILELRKGSYNTEAKTTLYTMEELQEAIDEMDSITRYRDIDSYHDSCDDCLEFTGDSIAERYFDYDAFHRDCDFDVTEASNWIVLSCY